MSFPGIRSVAHALSVLERMRDATANNLANADTHTFKLGRVTAELNNGSISPRAVHTLDLSQGAIRETGQVFDFALDGQAFLSVQTAQGVRLIRGGSFRVDPAGVLTDDFGNPVLGEKGVIPVAGSEVSVDTEGLIHVDGEVVDRLQLWEAQPDSLTRVGARQLVSNAELTAAEPGSTRVRQGALEEANVNTITSMVDMISTERSYGTNHTAMRVLDEVMGTISNSLGRIKS